MVVLLQAEHRKRECVSRPTRVAPAWPIALGLAAPFAFVAIAAAQQAASPDPIGPTPIEQALMEHVCGPARPTGSTFTEQYEACLKGQLESLRLDFGADLKQLSKAERKTLDTTCSKNRELGREEYVTCLSDQLVALSRKKKPAKRQAAEENAVPPPTIEEPSVSVTPVAPRPYGSLVWWIGGAIVVLVAAGGGVLLTRKPRPVARNCKVCGLVAESGDMCTTCRHEAADALRRGATERMEELKAQEEQHRQRQLDEEQRQQIAMEEDRIARLRQDELSQQKELARREEERRLREEEERLRSLDATASNEAFDPHVVLGVPRDARPDQVLAAYEEAKAKYAPDLVADLPMEVQAHFKAKGAAVERAYQALTKEAGIPTTP